MVRGLLSHVYLTYHGVDSLLASERATEPHRTCSGVRGRELCLSCAMCVFCRSSLPIVETGRGAAPFQYPKRTCPPFKGANGQVWLDTVLRVIRITNTSSTVFAARLCPGTIVTVSQSPISTTISLQGWTQQTYLEVNLRDILKALLNPRLPIPRRESRESHLRQQRTFLRVHLA